MTPQIELRKYFHPSRSHDIVMKIAFSAKSLSRAIYKYANQLFLATISPLQKH